MLWIRSFVPDCAPTCIASADGSYHTPNPSRLARAAKSVSSEYKKYDSSHSPTASWHAREMSRTAPSAQSTDPGCR